MVILAARRGVALSTVYKVAKKQGMTSYAIDKQHLLLVAMKVCLVEHGTKRLAALNFWSMGMLRFFSDIKVCQCILHTQCAK